MSRRRAQRRFPILGTLAVLIGLNIAVFVLYCIFELFPVLVLAAAVITLWVAHQRQHGDAPDMTQAAQLRAENADLRARLTAAEESAHAAWDAASSVPPRRPANPSTARDKLLADRLGGVHDLWERS